MVDSWWLQNIPFDHVIENANVGIFVFTLYKLCYIIYMINWSHIGYK